LFASGCRLTIIDVRFVPALVAVFAVWILITQNPLAALLLTGGAALVM